MFQENSCGTHLWFLRGPALKDKLFFFSPMKDKEPLKNTQEIREVPTAVPAAGET